MSDYPMIPPGEYRVKAVGSSFGWTKGDEPKEELTVKFQVVDGEHAGHILWWRAYFTEKAQERTLESLQHMGFADRDFLLVTETYATEADVAAIFPDDVRVVTEHEPPRNGYAARERVKWVNSLYGKGGGAMKQAANPLDARGKKDFAARMNAGRSPARAIGGGAGAKASPTRTSSDTHPAQRAARAAAQPGGDDQHYGDPSDDVPF